MNEAIPWRCPRCWSGLTPGEAVWTCVCSARYPAWRGIPDLRTRDDAYLSNAADRAFADRLMEHYEGSDFRTLLDRYFDLAEEIPPDRRAAQIDHILTAPERARLWLDALGDDLPDDAPLLDLGCGSGSFLAVVGHRSRPVCGVDIALRWLLVARKRLDEEGLAHVPLVCACSEDLPIDDDSFAGAVAGDVIEHVDDQAATLAEVHRVLVPGGRLFAASPNRYSLSCEPHVGLFGVGYLPRRWMPQYVRLAGRGDYRAIRNLGLGEWRRLLRSSPFGNAELTVPPLPRGDLQRFSRLKRSVGRCYNALVGWRPAQVVLGRIGPLFHVLAEKSRDVAATRHSRPIRRATRRG